MPEAMPSREDVSQQKEYLPTQERRMHLRAECHMRKDVSAVLCKASC